MKTITLKSGKEISLNQAFNMDCWEFMMGLPDKCIDLTVTSPPYDNLRTYNGLLKWNELIWSNILIELYRITKDGGVVVWIVGDATVNGSETGTSFKQALFAKECGFNIHDTMIYKKNSAPQTCDRYQPNFEYMFIFSKGKPKTFNPTKEKTKTYGTKRTTGHRNVEGKFSERDSVVKEYKTKTNIWEYQAGNGKDNFHPAVFPHKLARDHIVSWSNERDIVFEPFCGSFTTPIEAHKQNRNWLGCEKDYMYFKSGYHRYEQETKQMLMEF